MMAGGQRAQAGTVEHGRDDLQPERELLLALNAERVDLFPGAESVPAVWSHWAMWRR